MDGADESTTFTDSELTPKTVTANGNAQIDTAQSVFGGASGLFDGTGDYLSADDSADWAFGTGDFTIDFWVRFNTLPILSAWMMLYNQYVDSTHRFILGLENNNPLGIVWTVKNNADTVISVSTSISLNTWYHVALARSGNTWYVFQNGTQVGSSGSYSTAVSDLAAPLLISQYISGFAFNLDGWLDEYRVSKGVARWTSNFTPPTAPYNYWAHKFLGVANASIGKIAGVPIANVRKVGGI